MAPRQSQSRRTGWRRALQGLVAGGGLLALCGAAPAGEKPPGPALPSGGFSGSPFGAYLSGRLLDDGLSRELVERAVSDRRGEINATTLAYAIVYRESKADYSRFLDPERLARAREFIGRKAAALKEAEKKYRVPPEVTAAILMIESDFGRFRKLHRVLNVFATLLWAERPESFPAVRDVITGRLPDVSEQTIRERSRRKADWAYGQLKALLRIAEREGLDPFLIEGSWAGAFGLPQFIPSSYWAYAVDGNGDGKVDLYDEDDAIHSIGNYLSLSGWGEGISPERRKAVLRRYNNSGLYVDTVLAVAERLEGSGEM